MSQTHAARQTQEPGGEGRAGMGDRKNGVADRGVGAGPALQPMMPETPKKRPAPRGFVYSTLKWAPGLPALTSYDCDIRATLATAQRGRVVAIAECSCVYTEHVCCHHNIMNFLTGYTCKELLRLNCGCCRNTIDFHCLSFLHC